MWLTGVILAASFIRKEDPLKFYHGINQRIGEGASGVVYVSMPV